MISSHHTAVDSGAGVLVLAVELDKVTTYEVAETLGKQMIGAAQQHPGAHVVIDMRNLVSLSSVGYGPLISLRGRVDAGGGRLVLCNLSKVLKETLESTRLLINPKSPKSLFEYADTLEDALATLAGSP